MTQPLQRLHVRLAKASVRSIDAVLEDSGLLSSYKVRSDVGFDGRLYVAPPNEGPPPWLLFVQTGIDEKLKELSNKSNAAVLLLRRRGRILAITFGHGRHLLREDSLEPDFGLKAALNALRHDSLRSLDSFVVEEQTVHKRAQASRASGIEVFGLDVSRDILRAVTGSPRPDVPLQAVSGTGGTLAVSAHTDFKGLGPLSDQLLGLYRKRRYREHFAWVDNVQRVTDPATVDQLNELLLQDLRREEPTTYLAPPEPVDWERITGFGYTRARGARDTDMELSTYLSNVSRETITLDTLGAHKVSAFGGDDEQVWSWSCYKCLVFEARRASRRFVLTAGDWFEIDPGFAGRVATTLAQIPGARVRLPPVRRGDEGRLESEPDYNRRVAAESGTMALLDGQTVKCAGTSSGIEVCDLLSADRDLIHVKHRKGGSSSLSHLFAQGRMSAEALLRDEAFRAGARRLLRTIRASWDRRIPTEKPDPRDYRVVYAILGSGRNQGGPHELPFFSQLNLARSYETLTALGYRVELASVPVAA